MDMQDLKPALDQMTKAMAERFEKTEETMATLSLEITELARKGVNVLGKQGGQDTPSPGSIVVKDDGLELLRRGQSKSVRISVQDFGLDKKAVTSDGMPLVNLRDTEVYYKLPRPYAIRDLVPVRATQAPAVEFVQAARTGEAAPQAQEGDQKAEMALAFTLKTAQVSTIAVWVAASRQVLDDLPMLRDAIDFELRDALRLEEDAQLLYGDGLGGNLLGLLPQAVAYSRGQAGDKASDTIRRAITQVQLARGAASGIVVNPEGLERLELEKDGQGRYLAAYEVTDENGRARVWRLPVVVTDAMQAAEFMVADFQRAARLWDRKQATVELATQHADFFTRNLVALLAEERLALSVPRPDLLVKGSFAP